MGRMRARAHRQRTRTASGRGYVHTATTTTAIEARGASPINARRERREGSYLRHLAAPLSFSLTLLLHKPPNITHYPSAD